MLPKVIENRPWTGSPQQMFQPRVKYAHSKATTVYMMNLTGSWEDAAEQMAFALGLNPRLRTASSHLVFTWSETEGHSDAGMIEATKMVLEAFGAAAHQAVIAIHRDRLHAHVHVVLNRVHPVTGKALSMSDSYERLEHACRTAEHRLGWPADRGRFDVESDGEEITLRPKPAAHWELKKAARALGLRPEGRTAREQRRNAAGGYLRDTLGDDKITKLTSALDRTQSWQGVHSALSGIGLLYQSFRFGARIVEAGTRRHMPAGALGARHGMHRMVARLGEFVAASVPLSLIKTARPTDRWRRLRKLKRQHTRQRRSLRAQLNGMRSPCAQAFRAFVKDLQAKEIAALKATLHLPRPEADRVQSMQERYRLAARLHASPLADPDDHTARRQRWMLSTQEMNADLPAEVADVITRHPDALRPDGDKGVLFANRDTSGSIVSFTQLSLRTTDDALRPPVYAEGICAIGSQQADSCLMVCSPFDAIDEMLGRDGPMPLVIVVGTRLALHRAAQIAHLAQGRTVTIADAGFRDAPEVMTRLHRMFPNAEVWRDTPEKDSEDEPQPDEAHVETVPDDEGLTF